MVMKMVTAMIFLGINAVMNALTMVVQYANTAIDHKGIAGVSKRRAMEILDGVSHLLRVARLQNEIAPPPPKKNWIWSTVCKLGAL